MSVSPNERLKVWVRAGGRCVLCKTYLMEGKLSAAEVPLGEGAHVVGEQDTPGSPRGEYPLPSADRNLASNILLACPNCHTEIDKGLVSKTIRVEDLLRIKKLHEDQIHHQTALTDDRRTAVLRVLGNVRGASVSLSRSAAAEAVIRSNDRFPLFLAAYDRQGLEVDLRGLEGEVEGSHEYYQAATKVIDRGVRVRLREGITEDHVEHLSVFAFARLPLLVYLGAALDDAVPTDVYQRHRRSDSWVWPRDVSSQVTFRTEPTGPGDATSGDAVLITNLSGTTAISDIPAHLVTKSIFTIAPYPTGRAEDLFSSPVTLKAFEATVRDFFTTLEGSPKRVERLHLFGAMPLSAAVTFGRILKAPGLRPNVLLYDRTSAGYEWVLTV